MRSALTGGVVRPSLSSLAARRRSFVRTASRVFLGALAHLTLTTPAPAADKVTAASCVQANEDAGPLRREGKLREARARLRLCGAQSCPAAVRRDCLAGAVQADADVPTVAFSVQDQAGNDLAAVKVTVDGEPLADKLDGKAVDVDPGEHVFVFEAEGQPKVEKRFLIVEGEKNRRERVVMGEPRPVRPVVAPLPAVAPLLPSAARTAEGPRRKAGFGVGGAGLALLAGGAAAGVFATVEWRAAKNACGPAFPVNCQNPSAANSDRSATVTASTIADVVLGLGGAALVTGAVLVLSAPSSPPATPLASAFMLSPRVGPGAGGLVVLGEF